MKRETIIKRAMQRVATGKERFSCVALVTEDTSDSTADSYALFFNQTSWNPFWGFTNDADIAKQERLTALALFLVAGEDL